MVAFPNNGGTPSNSDRAVAAAALGAEAVVPLPLPKWPKARVVPAVVVCRFPGGGVMVDDKPLISDMSVLLPTSDRSMLISDPADDVG